MAQPKKDFQPQSDRNPGPQYPSNPQYPSGAQYPSEDIQRAAPDSMRRPSAPEYAPQKQSQDAFSRPPPAEPKYYANDPSLPPQQVQPQSFNYNQMQPASQYTPQIAGGQTNSMIEEQKKVIELYQNTLQQIMEFQKIMKDTSTPVPHSPQQFPNAQSQYASPPQYQRPVEVVSQPQQYMQEAERSNAALAHQLKDLYGDLGTMLATKQQQIDAGDTHVEQEEYGHDKFQTSGYKYSTKNDQPLQASSKLVKIRESEQPHFDDSQDHTPLGAMVETWNEHDFEHHTQNQQTNEKSYSQKKNKFINQSREGHVEQDDDINDIDLSRNDSDEEEKRKSPTPEQAFDNEKKFNQHKELLEAKNMLAQAMKDAQFLIKQENDIDDLATNTHKQDQLDKVGDINREMDEIEKMITNQDESNAKRQPMENSMSSIKSSKKHSVVESSRDPFDKLEDIGKNVTPEEVQMMEKTARTMKDAKRRPWADKGNKKAVNRTDYNKDVEDLEDDQDQEDQKTEHQSYKNDIMDTNNEIKA